jgi:hypothetical protein
MLDHPFGLSARGSKQKKLIVSLIEYISEVRALMDINVIFGWSKISNDTAPMVARSFGHIQLIGQEIIFNRLGSLAAKGLVPEFNLIQNTLTFAASM